MGIAQPGIHDRTGRAATLALPVARRGAGALDDPVEVVFDPARPGKPIAGDEQALGQPAIALVAPFELRRQHMYWSAKAVSWPSCRAWVNLSFPRIRPAS